MTNDDGYSAPGIDAVVQGLRTLPDVSITVVAPLANQSGTGGKTTPGTLAVTDVKTASGYAAKAVAGFPADTVIWAVDQHGLAQKPQVVISGVNFGQNLGVATNLSGTVGAARAAASRGIPALAASAGLAPPGVAAPDFATAVTQVKALDHPPPRRPGGGQGVVAGAAAEPEHAHLRRRPVGTGPGERAGGPAGHAGPDVGRTELRLHRRRSDR